MSFPRPKHYTPEALAKCWGEDISMIDSWNQTDKLKSHSFYSDLYGSGKGYYPLNCTEDEALQYCIFNNKTYLGQVYKLEEVIRFEKEHGINTSHAQDASPLAAKTQANKATTPQRKDSSIDDIISNITIRYEADDSITIQQKGKPQEVVDLTALKFQSGSKKLTWNNFLAVLQSPPNHYWECLESRDKKQIKVVSDRLIVWMTNNLSIKFPDGYRLYEMEKSKEPGTYRFKFKIEYPDTIPVHESSKKTFLKKFWDSVDLSLKFPDDESLQKKVKEKNTEGIIKKYLRTNELQKYLKKPTNQFKAIKDNNLFNSDNSDHTD